jgi:ABC-type multidrug transport system ATPase subunit
MSCAVVLHCAGALPPTGGDIRVLGHSLLAADGLEVAQGVMGVCPQFDVLWDELTGQEHMYIYGCIKGLPSFEVRASTWPTCMEVASACSANQLQLMPVCMPCHAMLLHTQS